MAEQRDARCSGGPGYASEALRTFEPAVAEPAGQDADLESGRYTDYTNETLPQMADELKREARALRDRERR